MKFILGKKLKMTQLFLPSGDTVAVTVVAAGPCQVTQVKTQKLDGYLAVQLGFGQKSKLVKPLLGHLKSLPKFRYLREFRLPQEQPFTVGQKITAAVFKEGDLVKATGLSKGKGFQGVVKRHHFSGSPATHGHKDQLRMPGSIGSTDSNRVFKGKRMAGHMGNETVTLANLEIVKVEPEKNLLYVKGALPGSVNGLILLQALGDLPEIKEQEAKEPEIKEQE